LRHLTAAAGAFHASVDRAEGQRFEARHIEVATLHRGCRQDVDQVLDANAEGARTVVARFVREDHAFEQFLRRKA
jgi:hypothetical protein